MAKIDYERDYYADLELPPTADVADIKKQFKKLALKYHPDRNPGKEDVVKDKFVVIQAAHELLTDPASKAKIDSYRRRPGSRFPAASGVRGNPYADLGKETTDRFGAPPTRRAAPTSASRPTPTTGAGRYTSWVPPTAKKAADATDNLRAWDRMRTGSGKGTQSNGSAPTAAKPTPPQPPPRTAAQARRHDAAFGSPTKKSGYAPKSPLGGDEPPVTNKNGYSSMHTRMFEETAANMRKSRPESSFVDPLSTQFGENYSDDRQRTPYASRVGEKTNPFEGVGVNRAKSARETFRGNHEDSDTPPPRPSRQRSASVDGSDGFKKSNEQATYPGASASPRQQSRASARYSPHGMGNASAPSTATFPQTPKENTPAAGSGYEGASKPRNGPTVFAVPDLDEDTIGSTAKFMRNSADNINTRFVAEEKAGDSFMFNAGGAADSSDPFLRVKQRSRSTPRGRQSPQRTYTGSSAGSANSPQTENPPPKPPKIFDPNQWEGGFEPHHFVPPPVAKPSTSPTRANRGAKKSKPPVRPTAGTAGLVDEEGSSGEEKLRPSTGADGFVNGAASPNAMDIDPPTPDPVIPPVTGARKMNVEPTKPEWRAGNVNGVKQGEGVKMGNGTNIPQIPDPNKAGSEDAPDFIRPNIFADFKNVEPFAAPKAGLGSMNDLASAIPFDSKPSTQVPIEKEKPKPVHRAFPPIPPAPRPPTVLGVASLKPSKHAWEEYVTAFEQYLCEWNAFNNKILTHFEARRRKVEQQKFGWAKRGDSYGLQEYLNGLEEDKAIRHRWIAACDQHELHVREMGKALERMKS